MAPVVPVNLTIEKGTTFEETFFFDNNDGSNFPLSDTTVVAKLKKHPQSEISYEFNYSIIISQGAITLTMSPDITSTLPSGRCVYDIIVEDSSHKKTKLVEGFIIVKDSVSI